MQNKAVRGIVYLCLGVFVFSLQDAIIKQVSGAYPLTEVVSIRSLVGLPILLALVQREVGWRAIFASHVGPLALRFAAEAPAQPAATLPAEGATSATSATAACVSPHSITPHRGP